MKALVTGGGGFLGSAIVRMLRARGDTVTSYSRGTYPELEALGVEHVRGDLSDVETLSQAVLGCSVVFHVAAYAGVGCRYAKYHAANVVGTENVMEACRRGGIKRLVHTSTPSVVFSGKDIEGLDESVPYGEDFLGAHYPRTKAEAERKVLAANGEELATVALRPRMIWGPGDNHLIPRLLARARAGRLRRVGDGKNVVDTAYIDDAAEAHLLAADALEPGSKVSGRAYFIAQGEPVPMWELIDRILQAAGLEPVKRSVPFWLAYAAGWLLEGIYGGLRLEAEPPMTRFVAVQLGLSSWFDISAAKRDFGYEPRVSVEEGLKRLAASFAAEREGSSGER
ncbi:NAD-dependent epimerase/dehydratase family protein [Planctomycetota bacterium]